MNIYKAHNKRKLKIKEKLKIPSHLISVNTLPCKTLAFKT